MPSGRWWPCRPSRRSTASPSARTTASPPSARCPRCSCGRTAATSSSVRRSSTTSRRTATSSATPAPPSRSRAGCSPTPTAASGTPPTPSRNVRRSKPPTARATPPGWCGMAGATVTHCKPPSRTLTPSSARVEPPLEPQSRESEIMSVSQPSFERSEALQRRLHELVPGGAHTFARGADQFPEGMAPVIVEGIGARVRDADDNWFVEYGSGMRAVTLGHAYEPVVAAVRDAIGRGVSFSRPSALELDAAEDFLALVTGADMVKFTKNASDATAAAVRLSRAATGRDHVAVSTQPFFSGQDWFVGTLPLDAGVPRAVRDLTHRFAYNDLDALRTLLDQQPVACVIMEAGSATAEPGPGYLEGVRALCDAHGAVLVFDETITGFR